VTNGVVQSVTPAPLSPSSSPPPSSTPPPSSSSNRCSRRRSPRSIRTLRLRAAGERLSPALGGSLQTTGDDATNALSFQLNGGSDPNGQAGFSYQFADFSNHLHSTLVDATSNRSVNTTLLYAPSTTFKYTPIGDLENPPAAWFSYQVVDNATQTVSPTKAADSVTAPDTDAPY
jgi:hypothetical protein